MTYTDFFKNIGPAWVLRIGLGVTYLYSGTSLIANPEFWYGFLPGWFSFFVTQLVEVNIYLRVQGVIEVFVGTLFLAWFFKAWALRIALLYSIFGLSVILTFFGIDLITFRDLGLLGAAIALGVMEIKKKLKINEA